MPSAAMSLRRPAFFRCRGSRGRADDGAQLLIAVLIADTWQWAPMSSVREPRDASSLPRRSEKPHTTCESDGGALHAFSLSTWKHVGGLAVDSGRSMPPDNRRTADSSNQSQEYHNAERD